MASSIAAIALSPTLTLIDAPRSLYSTSSKMPNACATPNISPILHEMIEMLVGQLFNALDMANVIAAIKICRVGT
jgi:hypothetical protein